MIQLSETFPTLDCSQCILTPKMVEVSKHPKIKLMTYSEVQDVTGYVGNFKVKILKKPTYVDAVEMQPLRRVHQGLPDRRAQRVRPRA